MALNWAQKLKRVWKLSESQTAKDLYKRLYVAKERFRNAVAHAGFEKSYVSLMVHVEGLGAVPASLSGFSESIHYGPFPLDHDSFLAVCELFDSVDSYLREGRTRFALMFAESGLDLPFDNDTRAELEQSMDSESSFEELLEHYCFTAARHVNMEW